MCLSIIKSYLFYNNLTWLNSCSVMINNWFDSISLIEYLNNTKALEDKNEYAPSIWVIKARIKSKVWLWSD